MKKFRIPSTFFAMLAVALIAFGCNENEDGPNDNVDVPNPVQNVRATSGSNTGAVGRVILRWDAPTSSATVSVTGYEITYAPDGPATPISVAAGTNTYTVENLTVGTTYTFTIKAKGSNNTVSNSRQIIWAPAMRSTALRLYGSQSTTNGSGVDLDGGPGGSPIALRIDQGGRWDLAFDDKGPRPVIGSPGQSLYINNNFEFPNGDIAKITKVSNDRSVDIANLDQVFETGSLTPGDSERVHYLDNTGNRPFAFVVKTEEGNYAKVLVLAEGGQIIHGTGSNAYIDIIVSYQPTVNVPYALPARPLDNVAVSKEWTTQRRPARSDATQIK